MHSKYARRLLPRGHTSASHQVGSVKVTRRSSGGKMGTARSPSARPRFRPSSGRSNTTQESFRAEFLGLLTENEVEYDPDRLWE